MASPTTEVVGSVKATTPELEVVTYPELIAIIVGPDTELHPNPVALEDIVILLPLCEIFMPEPALRVMTFCHTAVELVPVVVHIYKIEFTVSQQS